VVATTAALFLLVSKYGSRTSLLPAWPCSTPLVSPTQTPEKLKQAPAGPKDAVRLRRNLSKLYVAGLKLA